MTTTPAHSDFEKRAREFEKSNAELRGEVARLEALLTQEKITTSRLQLEQGSAIQRALRMRTILDAVPAMIGYWDSNLINGFANKAYIEWFGLEPGKVKGKHLREVIGEERYRLNLPYVEKVLSGIPQTFERAIPAPDGSSVRHSIAQYIPDFADGKVCGFYALVSDVSPAKEFEAALRVSEERYRSVVEDQTEVISRSNADGTLTFANGSYCRLFGKKSDEIIGSKWQPLVHPEDAERIAHELEMLTADHPVVIIENRVFSNNGKILWMQFINRGIFSPDGRLLEIQSVGSDITERKQAVAALIEAREKLEMRVVERTEQLRKLAVQATLAEENERRAIAHDLHDDLGQILHVARIKLDSLIKSSPPDLPPQLEDLLALITDSSRIVRSLTSQLSPPILRDLGLGPALNWLCDEMERNYGLVVHTRIEDIPVQLSEVEATILFRAARELLINVAKHAEADAANIELKFNAPFLLLSVEDNGVGIRSIDSVFTRNQGFGLSAIRERLLFLGGTTNIISKKEGGIRAELRIPVLLTKHS